MFLSTGGLSGRPAGLLQLESNTSENSRVLRCAGRTPNAGSAPAAPGGRGRCLLEILWACGFPSGTWEGHLAGADGQARESGEISHASPSFARKQHTFPDGQEVSSLRLGFCSSSSRAGPARSAGPPSGHPLVLLLCPLDRLALSAVLPRGVARAAQNPPVGLLEDGGLPLPMGGAQRPLPRAKLCRRIWGSARQPLRWPQSRGPIRIGLGPAFVGHFLFLFSFSPSLPLGLRSPDSFLSVHLQGTQLCPQDREL